MKFFITVVNDFLLSPKLPYSSYHECETRSNLTIKELLEISTLTFSIYSFTLIL